MNSPGDRATAGRQLWEVCEPIHAIIYFDRDCRRAARSAGAESFWHGYFGARLGPTGFSRPEAAAAVLYVFKPAFVAAHLPNPEMTARISSQRTTAAAKAIERAGGEIGLDVDDAHLAGTQILQVFEGACLAGRPITSSYVSEAQHSDGWAKLWLAATVAREYRWEGHIAALLDAQLDAVEAMLLALYWRGLPTDLAVADRGWEQEDAENAIDRLSHRELIVNGQLTSAGQTLRSQIEARTNKLALPSTTTALPLLMSTVASLSGLAKACTDTIPWDNPIGIGGNAASFSGRGVKAAGGIDHAER